MLWWNTWRVPTTDACHRAWGQGRSTQSVRACSLVFDWTWLLKDVRESVRWKGWGRVLDRGMVYAEVPRQERTNWLEKIARTVQLDCRVRGTVGRWRSWRILFLIYFYISVFPMKCQFRETLSNIELCRNFSYFRVLGFTLVLGKRKSTRMPGF